MIFILFLSDMMDMWSEDPKRLCYIRSRKIIFVLQEFPDTFTYWRNEILFWVYGFLFHLFADPLNKDELKSAIFIESRHGNPMLVDKEGHTFNDYLIRRNADGTKIYWRCGAYKSKENGCPVKAITKGIHVLKWTEKHNHWTIFLPIKSSQTW